MEGAAMFESKCTYIFVVLAKWEATHSKTHFFPVRGKKRFLMPKKGDKGTCPLDPSQNGGV